MNAEDCAFVHKDIAYYLVKYTVAAKNLFEHLNDAWFVFALEHTLKYVLYFVKIW